MDHQADQEKYRNMLRLEIGVRARDLLSREGKHPPDTNFWRFSSQLSLAFLEERNLTEDAIAYLNSTQLRSTERDSHVPLSELRRGLEGLTGYELKNMTLLYNFVSRQHS